MKNQYTFLSLLKGEHYKTKRNFALFLIIAFPLFISICVTAYLIYKSGEVDMAIPGINPWTFLLGRYIFGFYNFYPLITAILCYSLCDMEYKNDSFKQLFTLPFSKKMIFATKMIYLTEIILISSIIAFASYMASGLLLSHVAPQYNFQQFDVLGIAGIFFTKIFLYLLAVAFIQYCLSLMFKSFVVPVGIACFMTIFSAILSVLWDLNYLIPYCSIYDILQGFYKGSVEFNKYDVVCIAYVAILSVVGYYIMKKRSINTK